MSRVKTQNTDHSYIRAAERCGWGKKKAREMMKQASRFGIAAGNISPSPLQEYVAKKQYGNPYKRIKLYQGYIFVFCSTSTRCITVYPVPKELLEESEIVK
jgi:protein tyrosine phosphatase (PTP) superfamily phosphohydrolase (DUF442 family)